MRCIAAQGNGSLSVAAPADFDATTAVPRPRRHSQRTVGSGIQHDFAAVRRSESDLSVADGVGLNNDLSIAGGESDGI